MPITCDAGPTTRQVKRIKIKALWEKGYSQRQIAKDVGCDKKTVERWTGRFKEAKAQGVSDNIAVLDRPRSGAPLKITKSIGKAILQFTEGKTYRQAPAIQAYVQNKFNVTLSVGGIQRWLKDEGLKPYHRSKCLRLLDRHKEKRVKFARKYKRHDWLNTLFTDETDFPLHPKATNTKNDIVWARRAEDVPPAEVEQYSAKLHVWGGVSAKGKTRLIFYEGDLTAKKYRDKILKKAKPDFKTMFGARNNNWTFVHDGASAHKATITNEWLMANVPKHITSGPSGDWPANSPDLNSTIEHVWGYMDGALQENRPKTMTALKRRVKKLWQDMDQDMVEKQAGKMKKRLKSVIASGGEWTGD